MLIDRNLRHAMSIVMLLWCVCTNDIAMCGRVFRSRCSPVVLAADELLEAASQENGLSEVLEVHLLCVHHLSK
jgi:hypothetical protein